MGGSVVVQYTHTPNANPVSSVRPSHCQDRPEINIQDRRPAGRARVPRDHCGALVQRHVGHEDAGGIRGHLPVLSVLQPR